jgi:hypothetical protein
MEPICCLRGCWNRTPSGSSIISSAISTHQCDFRVRRHPRGRGFSFSIRQDINDPMTLQIYQDSAVISSPPEREIVYSKLSHSLDRLSWQGHDPAKNRHPRGVYS